MSENSKNDDNGFSTEDDGNNSSFEEQKNEENPVDIGEKLKPKGTGKNTNSEGDIGIELNQANIELNKAKSDLLYLRAEFDNFRRNTIKERSQLIKFGAERLVHDLLEVLDNFDRALEVEVTPETVDSFKQGVEMTSQELKDTLKKHGVAELPSLGEIFNPMHHEALGSEPTDNFEPGVVSKVFKKAYKMHDKVIRPGQVVVATEIKDQENENNK